MVEWWRALNRGHILVLALWQEQAFEEKEKYKEGKYIIEKAKMTKENW